MNPSLSLLLSVLFALPGLAQHKVLPVRAELITVDDGLPQGMVWATVQDRQGFLWIATKDGLVRYDGYGYRVFRNVPGDSTSLAGNHITALLEDKEGFIWVGTEGDGLHCYDPASGLFRRIRRSPALGGNVRISNLEKDTFGNLWVQQITGPLCVIRAEQSAGGGQVLEPAYHMDPALRVFDVHAMRTDGSGGLWLLGRSDLQVWKPRQGGYEERFHWSTGSPVTKEDRRSGLVHHTALGHMLVVRRNEVIVFDISSFAVLDTFLLPVVPLRGGSMLIDDHDRLWSHGPKGTWWRRNLRTGREEILQPLVNGGLPIPGDGQLSWMMDRSGTIWSGTPGFGLVKYRTTSERFHHHALSEEGVARSALVTSDLSGKEVLVFEQFLPLGRTDGVMDSIPLRKALAKENIMPCWGICVRDPAGRYWVSGPEQEPSAQLYRFDPRTMALDRSSDAADGNCAGLYPGQGTDVWALMAEKERSEGARLWRVDSRTGEVADTFHFPDLLPSLGFRGIACWRIDPAGTIWMGTRNGVYGLDPVQGTWSHFTHSEGDSSSISSNEVFSLCLDPEQPERYLWVGTDGKGMSRLDRLSGKCDRQVTSREGLPNDVVYGILPDARGNLWLSTNMGICQYFPGTGHTNNYSMADGLIGNEFNRYSAERSADGTLYFGGMEGITWFDPEDFYHVRSASPTLITELKLLNKPVRVTDQQVFLPVPVEQLKELVLPYSERMITFGFASTDLSVPAQNEYRYILEGLNTIWIENGTGHEATFTNLDPGSYTFRVQGRNSAGVWDEQGASLHLTILPPWWGTWWFRALMGLFLAGSLYAFFRYRLARAMEVVNVRDQIARDLHDEIGSTLSSVALYSTVAQKKAGDKVPEASAMLGRISESTTSVMEAMNDIVWAVNAENDNMGHVVQRMRDFAVRITEAGECALHFEVGKELRNARIGMTQRKNLYLVFKEAVNNAMKYAACSNVHVRLRRVNSTIVLTVQDDGIGFDPDNKRNGGLGGNGLSNMRKRAADMQGTLSIRSSAGQGTTVELVFGSPVANKSLDPMMVDRNGAR